MVIVKHRTDCENIKINVPKKEKMLNEHSTKYTSTLRKELN